MPNRDKTGPEGKGPKTGRQMGTCKDAEPTQGRGFFRRCGMRRRPRRMCRFEEDEEEKTDSQKE